MTKTQKENSGVTLNDVLIALMVIEAISGTAKLPVNIAAQIFSAKQRLLPQREFLNQEIEKITEEFDAKITPAGVILNSADTEKDAQAKSALAELLSVPIELEKLRLNLPASVNITGDEYAALNKVFLLN